MRATLLLLTAILAAHLFAQNWSDPVNVSNMPGYDSYADFCIDGNGVIHVVWQHEFRVERDRKIMYSKSTDNGLTWSVPVVISEDIEDLMGNPRIVVDSQNNLHVTYYYHHRENNQLHYRKCTNQVWGDFVDVVPEHCSIYNLELVVDNNDRVYVFWLLMADSSKFHYRYIDGEQWSPTFTPFSESQEYYCIVALAVDTNNNFHAIGGCTDGELSNLISYYYYDSAADIWQEPVMLGTLRWAWGYDIALDLQNNPHLIWREFISGVPNYEMTKYSCFNGQEWSEPEVVTEFGRWQTMVIDRSGTKHVVESKKFVIDQYNSVWDLVYYSGDDWDTGETLTNSGYIATLPKLIIRNGNLYLLYTENPRPVEATEVYLMKRQLASDVSDPVSNVPSLIQLHQNTPNPFRQRTQINYSLKMGGFTNMRIYNTKGQLIKNLVNDSKKAGNHSVYWDGRDSDNRQCSNGVYLINMTVNGQHVCSKKVTLLR